MNINKLVKVKDKPNLLRDISSKGVLNTDHNGLLEYRQAKEKRALKNKAISQCEDDINILKDEMKDIRDSLKLILERLTPKD